MNEQYSETHPLMKFVAMDLLKMDFADGSFSCFLDKGTLDALMSDASPDSKERAIKMFLVKLQKSKCFEWIIIYYFFSQICLTNYTQHMYLIWSGFI